MDYFIIQKRNDDDGMTAVSIGLPFTDQTDELALAIRSVLSQTHSEWELLLVGDGPTEAATSVARTFDDPRIRLIQYRSRSGLGATLNRVAGLAQFPLLARMDGDDIMHPNRIARQAQEFEENSDLDVLGTNAYIIDEQSRLVGAFREPPLPSDGQGFLRSNAFSHPTIMARTSWFRNNPYDESLLRAQDKELWLRTWASSTFAKVPDRLMYYRVPRLLSAKRLQRNEAYNRQILFKYARSLSSSRDLAKYVSVSYGKQLLFTAAGCQHLARYLYDRKVAPISTAERIEAETWLNQVKANAQRHRPYS
ncbi:glycosyltransferase [Pseudarthrobacter sp. TAF60_1]|uniref:glycosyltransferase n=1 Tax=Pseudarthrobacter sp. TAF60_1 TaxID=3233071 RepID=UPI003F971CDB